MSKSAPSPSLFIDDSNSRIAKTPNVQAIDDTGIDNNEIAIFDKTNKTIKTSNKTTTETLGVDHTTIPTSKAVKDVTDTKLSANTPIAAGTHTKITYDTNGFVTAGEAATTADIAESTNKNYVTDAEKTIIGNTSGVNTGNQDLSGLVPYTGATGNVDLGKHELQNAVIHKLSTFPADAKEGQIVYHTVFKAFFVCVNESGDTTLKGFWRVGGINIGDLYQEQGEGYLLITNNLNGISFTNSLDGGIF